VARNLQRIIIRLGDYGRKAIASPTPGIVALIRQAKANRKKLTRDRVVPTVNARAEQYRTATGERE
jgi:Iap family predicted aminopeptidase